MTTSGSTSVEEPNTGSEALQRFALGVEYDGSAYNGWQMQPHAPSIQESLSKAISFVANEPVKAFGAGRTDTGVHATMQVAHFESHANREEKNWLFGINTNLPDDIVVKWIRPVSSEFSARFSARSRSYRYLLLNHPERPSKNSALDRLRAWSVQQPLDVGAMHRAAQLLEGKHDFDAFRASSCQSPTSIRTMHKLSVVRDGAAILFDICGDAFLHHMVRNITGTLVKVGSGEASEEWVAELLASRDRKLSGMTAPPHGLYFTDVVYPDEFGLPRGGYPVFPLSGRSTL